MTTTYLTFDMRSGRILSVHHAAIDPRKRVLALSIMGSMTPKSTTSILG